MRPELPYLTAGSIAIAGGSVRDGGWPKEGTGALVGTVVLVVVASATAETQFAPLVKAFGLLLLMVAVFATVPAFQAAAKKKRKKKGG